MVNAQALYSALMQRGFNTVGNVCCGVWGGYAVSIVSIQMPVFQVSFAVRADKKDNALRTAVHQALRERVGKSVTGTLNAGDNFTITLRLGGKEAPLDQFAPAADGIAEVLREKGLVPAQTCACCGRGGAESLCMVTTFQPVHASCMEQKIQSVKADVESNQQNGSYLTGALGALLGALVGAIPAIAILLLTDTLYSILFALVPLAAMYGYRLLKGKNDKVSIVIVIVVSILSVVFMVFVLSVILLMREYSVSLGDALHYMFNYVDFSDFMEIVVSFWQGFLFMLLGIAASWGYLSKTGKSQVADAELLMKTLRPNPMYHGSAQDSSQS